MQDRSTTKTEGKRLKNTIWREAIQLRSDNGMERGAKYTVYIKRELKQILTFCAS